MKIIIALLIFLLLAIPASADNVTIEILENADGELYIVYGTQIIPCINDKCTFNVSTYEGGDYSISNADATKIAQRVAIEMKLPTTTFYSGSVNETFINTALGNNRETITDNLRAYIDNTVVPSVAELDESKNKLAEAELTITDLQSKAREYDSLKETKDETISTLKRENGRLEYIAIIALIGFVFVIITCSDAGKEALDYIGKFRRNR